MSQASGDGGDSSSSSTSNHMATMVPSFDPAKDDLEQYSQKVEPLGEIWPASKMNELITRLILNTTGTAFQKLQLNRDKLLTNHKSGIQLLVTLLWGQRGEMNLERKYESVEKALFKCVQRQDESNDSFLARCDVNWSELKAKKIDLDEVHAYIVLRGSLLTAEDKKRVIVESGVEKDGTLTGDKVNKSVRILGTAFFNDMIGQKRAKGKIYYNQVLLAEDVAEGQDDSCFCSRRWPRRSTLSSFSTRLMKMQHWWQITNLPWQRQFKEDLAAAYTSYSEARKRLSDRFKSRGFWPLGPTKGKVNHQATRVVVSLVENSPRSRCNNGYLKVHAASAVSQGIGKLSVQKDLKLA